jgi:hypothetical protein
MLRAWQQARYKLQGVAASTGFTLRGLASPTWPADVPVPAGLKAFDPTGPLSQIDELAEGLDGNDPFVKFALHIKDLKVAVAKLEAEDKEVRVHGQSISGPRLVPDGHKSQPWLFPLDN